MKTIPAAAGVVADRSLVGTALAAAYTAEIDAWLGSVIDDVGDVPVSRWRRWVVTAVVI